MIFGAIEVEINLADFYVDLFQANRYFKNFYAKTLQRFLFVDFARSDFRVIFSKICL